MAKLTITEALAELKTLDKRIEKKRKFVLLYVVRQEMMKDPLEKDGGSVSAVSRERQAIMDLLQRKVAIRRAIQTVNAEESVTIGDTRRTIAEWLVWRREVAPTCKELLGEICERIENSRRDSLQLEARRSMTHRKYEDDSAAAPARSTDFVVNVNEQDLARQIEGVEEILGTLDGQLSLKNATITIEV